MSADMGKGARWGRLRHLDERVIELLQHQLPQRLALLLLQLVEAMRIARRLHAGVAQAAAHLHVQRIRDLSRLHRPNRRRAITLLLRATSFLSHHDPAAAANGAHERSDPAARLGPIAREYGHLSRRRAKKKLSVSQLALLWRCWNLPEFGGVVWTVLGMRSC